MNKTKTRTFLALRNAVVAGMVMILNFPIQFVNRYFIVHYLGVTYLGLTSLFTNILSVLSLADLGIGTSIVFLLYQPLADRNQTKIAILMRYYRRIYQGIAGVIFALGIAMIPFLKFMIGKDVNYPHVYWLFLIYLLGSASSYLFSYNQSLLYADQQNHVVSTVNLIVTYVMLSIQIATVLVFTDPLLYAGLFVFTGFVTNVLVAIYVQRHYQLPPVKGKLSLAEKQLLVQNVIGNMFLRVSGVVVTGTDNIFLSAFAGVVQVGLYANYVMITAVIQRFMTQVIGAITGSIGNFTVNRERHEGEQLFFNLQFINFIIVNLAFLGIYFLSNDVITLWLGSKYTLSGMNVGLIAFSFYLMNYRMVGWNFVSVYGLAQFMKAFSVNEMVANVGLTLLFLGVFKLKLTGILLGTICSTLLTVTWQDPYIIFKHAFHSRVFPYFKRYGYNLMILLLEVGLLSISVQRVNEAIGNPGVRLVGLGLLVIVVGLLTPMVCYLQTSELKYTLSISRRIKERFS